MVDSLVGEQATTIEEIKRGLATSGSVHVTRAEWELRNQTVDERFAGVRGDLVRLDQEAKSRRAPWWSVVSVIAAVCALVWSIFGPTVIAL